MTRKAEPTSKQLHDLTGRKITFVRVGHANYTDIQGKVPGNRFLANFDVLVRKGTGGAFAFLVLDPYGACDSGMPRELLRHTEVQNLDILINRDTGEVHPCAFYLQGRVVSMDVLPKLWRVPAEYRSRLEELSCQKRPYGFLFDAQTLPNVVTGYYGQERLAEALVIALNFIGETVELDQDGSYRTTTPWKSA
jgi:hypothetical protein